MTAFANLKELKQKDVIAKPQALANSKYCGQDACVLRQDRRLCNYIINVSLAIVLLLLVASVFTECGGGKGSTPTALTGDK